MRSESERARYWRANLRIAVALLGVWVLVCVAPVWWAQALNRYSFLGWPLAFWLGAQAAVFACMGIVWIHGRLMDRLERDFERSAPPPAAPDAH
jgi:putative solute:sodium symporter small subunit